MPDLDERIRHAYGPVGEEAGWDAVVPLLGMPRPARRRGWRHGTRGLVAIAAAIVSLSSAAWAAQQESVQELIGVDESRPADRMEVFDEDEPAAGTRGTSRWIREMVESASTFPSVTEVDPTELRHLLTYRRGDLVVHVRAAPSENGQACLFVEVVGRSGGASCGGGMRFNGHVSVGTQRDIRMGTLVIGMADDDVRRIGIRLSDGRTVDALLRRNAFVFHMPPGGPMTRGLQLELTDGSTVEVAMNGCLREQVVPPPKSRLGCGFGMNKGPGDDDGAR